MKKRKITISILIILLLICLAVWWAWGGEDPQVANLRKMQEDMFASGKPPDREQMEKMRKEIDKLTEEQRRELFRPSPEQMDKMEKRLSKELDDFFALPKDKKNDYLDKRIQEMEKRRKDMEERQKKGETGPPGGPGGGPPMGPGPGGPGFGGPGGPGPGGAGQGGPPGGRPPGGPGATPDQRAKRRNDMLNHTSPSGRAKHGAFREAMQKRRAALGLSVDPPRPPRPPSGR